MCNNTTESTKTLEVVEIYLWLIGILVSLLCFAGQCLLFILRPKIRKLDQKILAQLTVARCVNTLTEFLIGNLVFTKHSRIVVFALYFQSDAVQISWMFVFTKNLYDKVVQVFILQNWNFIRLSILIWVLTITIGVIGVLLISTDYFYYYYKTWAVTKFIFMLVNLLFFGNVFYVIYKRTTNINRHFIDIVKTCVISFLLVCVTSLQVLLTDLTSFFSENNLISNIFCIINSYQVVAITIVFVVLVKNS